MWGGSVISKKLISHFDLNVFSRVVWILWQLTAFILELNQKNLPGRKSTAWNTALITQYLLKLDLSEICLLYSAVDFFIFFSKPDGGLHGTGLSICVFTNTVNNSAHLKDRELQLLDLFLLIILEMHPSAALECVACVCFLTKPRASEKIRSKSVKPWEMKKLTWDCEKGS